MKISIYFCSLVYLKQNGVIVDFGEIFNELLTKIIADTKIMDIC